MRCPLFGRHEEQSGRDADTVKCLSLTLTGSRALLFDHLVGAAQQRNSEGKVRLVGSLELYGHFDCRRQTGSQTNKAQAQRICDYRYRAEAHRRRRDDWDEQQAKRRIENARREWNTEYVVDEGEHSFQSAGRLGLAPGLTTKPDLRKIRAQSPTESSQDPDAVVADDNSFCPRAGRPVRGRPVCGRSRVTAGQRPRYSPRFSRPSRPRPRRQRNVPSSR